jgi:hypothetical protein
MPRFMSSAASSSSGRAEQPAAASELAPYIESSAVPPANTCASNGSYTDVFRFASMNLGWQITSKKHTAEWLCTAVVLRTRVSSNRTSQILMGFKAILTRLSGLL